MKITHASVFLSLTLQSRLVLLNMHGYTPDGSENNDVPLSALCLPKDLMTGVCRDLEKIAILGSSSADPILHQCLVAAGWTTEIFATSANSRERALALLLINRTAFEDAMRVWNANRLYWLEVQESGFQLPQDLSSIDTLEWAMGPVGTDHPLSSVVQSIMARHFAGKQFCKAYLLRRSNSGLDTESQTLFQLDMSYGEDSQTIDVFQEGDEAKIDVSFLSRIVVIIDLDGRTIHVGSTVKKKAYREDLAKGISQALLSPGISLSNLDPIRVFPQKLKTKPTFRRDASAGISDIQVKALTYHETGDPWAISRTIYTNSRTKSLYDLPDFMYAPHRKQVFQGAIDFYFGDKNSAAAPVKRTVKLSHPSGISYGKAFPHQRVAIRRTLEKAGLIDPQFDWSDEPSFQNLLDMLSPQHELAIRSKWPWEHVVALEDAGILVQGEPANEIWCDVCERIHDTGDSYDQKAVGRWAKCPFQEFPVTDDMLDTLVLDLPGLVSWLGSSLEADQSRPTNLDNSAWFLGGTRLRASSAPIGIYFAIEPFDPNILSKLIEHITILPLKKGIILSLTPQGTPFTIMKGWKVIPLHLALSQKDGGLRLERGKLAAYLKGSTTETDKPKKKAWEDFFKRFEETDTRGGHYTEARRMIQEYPEICPADERQLALNLKKKYPQRFSDAKDR